MGITIDVTGIRRYEPSDSYTSGKTLIILDYTKKDERVTTLKVRLLSGSTEVGSNPI